MLEVREPNDARPPVARSLCVTGLKLLEPEDALASRCRVRYGGTAHAAQPDDDDIKNAHAAMLMLSLNPFSSRCRMK